MYLTVFSRTAAAICIMNVYVVKIRLSLHTAVLHIVCTAQLCQHSSAFIYQYINSTNLPTITLECFFSGGLLLCNIPLLHFYGHNKHIC